MGSWRGVGSGRGRPPAPGRVKSTPLPLKARTDAPKGAEEVAGPSLSAQTQTPGSSSWSPHGTREHPAVTFDSSASRCPSAAAHEENRQVEAAKEARRGAPWTPAPRQLVAGAPFTVAQPAPFANPTPQRPPDERERDSDCCCCCPASACECLKITHCECIAHRCRNMQNNKGV